MLNNLLVYLPLSLIGLWRWSYWLVRVVGASLYRPTYERWPKGKPLPSISVVTPVYNEEDELFHSAMKSWIQNGVNEIIAVIDSSNTHMIVEFERRYSKIRGVHCKAVVTPKQGKRGTNSLLPKRGDFK
jgi:cellulose synthase/poly-beta-1,6-N-acetylglucosamine synthase-like glycosyltransferase